MATNISTLLELVLGSERGLDVTQVITYGSKNLPIIAVLLSSSNPVHLYVGDEEEPFNKSELEWLKLVGPELIIHKSLPSCAQSEIVLCSCKNINGFQQFVDGVVLPNVLFIYNTSKISVSQAFVLRKRMSTPLTTPAAEAMLQAIAGVPVTADVVGPSEEDIGVFHSHLQELSGVPADPLHSPICFTSGLAATCSLWMALIRQGGADIVMASTAYGGSSELVDILSLRFPAGFTKHKFDITGRNDISLAISTALSGLSSNPSSLLPWTVLFVEVPTNPDMKVPDVGDLAAQLVQYRLDTGRQVLMLVDTTFAPGSKVLQKIARVAPDLASMAFVSMSKSVSRGFTTAGALVAGGAPASADLLRLVGEASRMMDSTAKRDQMSRLVANHVGVEERCLTAYQVAVAVGENLRSAVSQHCGGLDMPLAFVTPEQAEIGFTSSTFSFNLPAIASASEEVNEALAQQFVDLLTTHPEFKACVSFGQDNRLVYATVPATSTQGAIKLEDKGKQAVGGVQLTRLSFPPTCDVEKISGIISDAVALCYSSFPGN